MRIARNPRAFSLVEILIVVVIIGILAAIAVPKFSNASTAARENTIKEDLRLLRTQLGLYKGQHALYPGYPGGDGTATPTAQAAYDQLLKFTDGLGNTAGSSSASFKWGPYLNDLPINPINGSKDWKILSDTDVFVPDGTTGWLYQPSTGQIKANVTGDDSTGKPIIGY